MIALEDTNEDSMDSLFNRFKSKAEVGRLLNIFPEAVSNAYRRNVVPTTWLPTLITNGFTISELMELPLQTEALELLKTITSSYHMKRKSPKNRGKCKHRVIKEQKNSI